ncbi:MAG: hypothetical protein LBG43_03515 [Treponema sp.]|jgi:hypothetical protein|nr:hypothetical protein [Treponema sp.]
MVDRAIVRDQIIRFLDGEDLNGKSLWLNIMEVEFGCIAADSWFRSNEIMRFLQEKTKAFMFEMKDNRLAARSEEGDGKAGLSTPEGTPTPVILKGLQFQAILYRQVFKNKGGSAGERHSAANDKTMAGVRFKSFTRNGGTLRHVIKA